jgi:hypothetical protein
VTPTPFTLSLSKGTPFLLRHKQGAAFDKLRPNGEWGRVEREDGKRYILRVVTLDDGETVHNAFFDRDFKEGDA